MIASVDSLFASCPLSATFLTSTAWTPKSSENTGPPQVVSFPRIGDLDCWFSNLYFGVDSYFTLCKNEGFPEPPIPTTNWGLPELAFQALRCNFDDSRSRIEKNAAVPFALAFDEGDAPPARKRKKKKEEPFFCPAAFTRP